MKLKVEKWIERGSFSHGTKQLFYESFLCYKIGAYRASLLYSYLGFLTVLKDRLTLADKPSHIAIGKWDKLQKNIQKENHWEEAVFTSTQDSGNPLFQIDDHIRVQIKYWKDRRNDCAHYKDNEISEHHVESLWSFIQSNLFKITVEGGKDSLINKFDNHFDPTKTKPGKDYQHLISEIEPSMNSSDVPSFLNAIKQIVNKHSIADEEFINVCEHMLQLSEAYARSVITYMRNTNDLYVEFILKKPQLLNYFNFSDTEIRSIWKTKLKSGNDNLSLLAAFLRNDLIPQDELEEGFNVFLHKSYNAPKSKNLDSVLWDKGFYDFVYRKYFTNGTLSDYESTNSRSNIIMHYIKEKGFNDEMIQKICTSLDQHYHSWSLAKALDKYFEEKPTIKQEFTDSAARLQVGLPRHIPALRI